MDTRSVQNTFDTALANADAAKACGVSSALKGCNTFEEVKEAATKFEAFFVHYLIKQMRKTVPQGELMSGGRGEEVFRNFFDQEIADRASERQEFGITKLMVARLMDNLSGEEKKKAADFVGVKLLPPRRIFNNYYPLKGEDSKGKLFSLRESGREIALPDREGKQWFSLK